MENNFNRAIEIIKEQNIDGCITGSCMLGYKEGWNQDIDVFVYNKQSYMALLYYMHYNPMFQILDPLELHKFDEFTRLDRSSLKQLGLITIKFKYNLIIDVNVIFKERHKDLFSVLADFDLDIIATGYDLKVKKTLSLRESTGTDIFWNKWNQSFYSLNQWSTKRLLRQFERVVKYVDRGYNLDSVIDKYISLVEEILSTENFYKTEKGTNFYNNTIEQFGVIMKILKQYKKELKITPEELLLLKTLI